MLEKLKRFIKQKLLPLLVDGIEIIDHLQALDINENSVLVFKTRLELEREQMELMKTTINAVLPNRVLILNYDTSLVAIINPEPKKEVK